MKDIYKDTFIFKVCNELGIDIKELALILNKTNKCIENWRKDESNIPAREKQYLKLLLENNSLKNEIRRMEKHKVLLSENIDSNEFGASKIDIAVKNGVLKRLCKYKIILEEV
ncbi:hypothetical protein [Arcobacter roscoffensis]|uniref:Transposase n=1 Tax=Arcobacter roscoffensis TaxID=2961520 RepID=A0ABY5DZN2_9BACT|nr:hypothetical protein [Arcobacter roscoffensis]UTJ05417.1 hypothetical protein NJU99_09065 [Arcobacter roscoffensis]